MKNRNKWMIGGMLLAALGIGSFFTQQTAVTAAEINIPYTDSNQGFTTGMDGTSLCLNLRNANNCICEDIPQDVACSGYLSVTFSIHGIGTDAYRLQKDGTQGTPYFAELVGVVRSAQDEEILRFCNGEEDDFAPGTVAITGDGTYTVRTELTQDADQILSLAVNTNIDLYRYQEEGNLAKSGITMQVESVTTQQETATKQATAKQETPIFAQDFNTTMPMTTTQRATTTTSTTPYWYGTTTSTTPYWYWTTTRIEATTTAMTWRTKPVQGMTTIKKTASSRGYYLSALDQSSTIGLGEQLQLFVGNDGSYTVSSSNHQDIIPAWVSFQPDVATVDNTGLVTAVSEGKAVIAAEISSFQLETVEEFKPCVSAILNITPDHLNRHKTMDCYIDTKFLITKNQGPDEICVLNYEDDVLRKRADELSCKVVFFSSRTKLDNGIYMDGERNIYLADQGRGYTPCVRIQGYLPYEYKRDEIGRCA